MHLLSHSKLFKHVAPFEVPLSFEEDNKATLKLQAKQTSKHLLILTKENELELRPPSPHKYYSKSSIDNNSQTFAETLHVPLRTPGLSKFIPATELLSFKTFPTLKEENLNSEISDNSFSNISFEDEPKHKRVYPSISNERNSLLASTNHQIIESRMSTPQNIIKISEKDISYNNTSGTKKSARVNTFEKIGLYKKAKRQFLITRKIYCEKCNKNVNTHTIYKKMSQNL